MAEAAARATAPLAEPPSISEDEFRLACQRLVQQCEAAGLEQCGWLEVSFSDQKHLNITKPLPSLEAAREDASSEFMVSSDSDEEELMVTRPQTRACVEYSIALSPIYRVPVLYFNFINVPMEQSQSIDTVYEHLVPSHFKDPLKEVGVMGGISMQNHPVTGRPSFFIHPCNTPSAMETVAQSTELTPDNYLMVWLGVVGGCVGLDVPFALGGQTVAADPKSGQ